jgi:hypothetical protein
MSKENKPEKFTVDDMTTEDKVAMWTALNNAAESLVAIHAILEQSVEFGPGTYEKAISAAMFGCKQTMKEIGMDVNEEQFKKVRDFIRKQGEKAMKEAKARGGQN